jgi:hypothetical protein
VDASNISGSHEVLTFGEIAARKKATMQNHHRPDLGPVREKAGGSMSWLTGGKQLRS